MRKFSNALELQDLLIGDPKFAACMVSKLYTYALRRAPLKGQGVLDKLLLERLSARFQDGFRLRELMFDVVTADTFLERRGEGN